MFTADGVLTIYSLGDSIFLSNVLNGIAMITTGGDSSTDRGSFLYITAIGAMFGFILTALRGLQTGKAFDLNSLMLCIIAWYFFFGWNVSVSIRDVFHNEDRLVAHVPGGVALTGSAISSLGWGLTSIYEQAFLPVTAEGGISKGLAKGAPFADTAKTLNALTALGANPALITALDKGSPKGTANRISMRENIINYINECTMKAVNLGYKNLSDVFHMTVVPEGSSSGANSSGGGPVDETSALSFNNGGNIYMTSYDGKNVNCSTALNSMNKDLDSALKSTSVRAIIAANTVPPSQKQTNSGFSRSSSSSDDSAYALKKIDDVMNILGKDADEAQNMMKASIYYHLFPLGAASNALSAGDRATATMLEQARMQRNTQWSGEGTMFQQTMIPIMTFIEGFTYAVTPFMGLFLLLGMFGVSLSIKYFMLVAWVQSWMPCLAIANNYIDSSLQRAISDFGMYTANNVTQGRLDSFEGVMRVMDIAQNHIATAGMFIGAIPIITLFIFSGSIYALSSLTSRMNGAEFINERIPTPDILSPAAVMSMMSQQNGLNGMVNANGAPWEMISFNTLAATERGLAFKNLNSIQNSLSTAAQKAGSTVFSSNSQTSIADVWNYGISSNYSDNRQISDQIAKTIADKTGWAVGSAENNQAVSEFSMTGSIMGVLRAGFKSTSSQDISWSDVKEGLNQQQQQLVDSGAYSADYTSAFGSMLNENNSVASGKTVDASTVQSINEGAQKLDSASKELTRTSKLAQSSQLTQAVSLDQLLYQSNNNKAIRSAANDFYQNADKGVKQSIDALANQIDSENKTSDPRLAATLSVMSKTDEGRQAIGEAVWHSDSTKLKGYVDPNDPNNTKDLKNEKQLNQNLVALQNSTEATYNANKTQAEQGIKVSTEKDVRDLNEINRGIAVEGHYGKDGTLERAVSDATKAKYKKILDTEESKFHENMKAVTPRQGTMSAAKTLTSESMVYKNLDTNTNMYKKDKDGRITREGYEEKLNQAVATTADSVLLKETYKDTNGNVVETQASKDSRELFMATSKLAYLNGVGNSGLSGPRMDLNLTEETEMKRDAQIALDNARAKWKESHPTATNDDLWALEHQAVDYSIYGAQSSDNQINTANSFSMADRIGTARTFLSKE